LSWIPVISKTICNCITYQGHGTDKVLFGGLLGLATDDTQDRQSIEMAKEYGMEFDFAFEDHCDF